MHSKRGSKEDAQAEGSVQNAVASVVKRRSMASAQFVPAYAVESGGADITIVACRKLLLQKALPKDQLIVEDSHAPEQLQTPQVMSTTDVTITTVVPFTRGRWGAASAARRRLWS